MQVVKAASPRTKVVFNAPIEIELIAPKLKERGSDWGHAEIQTYIYEAIGRGYDENAIVVRRNETSYMRRDVTNWGIIKRVWRYRSHTGGTYLPYEVLWFKTGETTGLWDDALWLVHKHQSTAELDAIFKAQENEEASNEPV